MPGLTSTYQVIVEEDRPKKLKRELGGQECFPVPLTFDDAVSRGSVHYFGAELPASSLTEAKPFTVGDNQTYSGYWNPPLEPKKAYLLYFQAMSNLKGVSSPGILLQPGVDQVKAGWGLRAGKNGTSFRSPFPGSPSVFCQGTTGAPGHPYGMGGCPAPAPLGGPCPYLCADAGAGVTQFPPHTAVLARTPPSTSAREIPFLGLLLGWRGLVWAARAVCYCGTQRWQDGQSQLQRTAGSSWAALPSVLLPVPSEELHPQG